MYRTLIKLKIKNKESRPDLGIFLLLLVAVSCFWKASVQITCISVCIMLLLTLQGKKKKIH